METNEAYYGGKVHKVLNNTLSRKLTLREYENLVRNIQNMLEAARQSEKNILIEVMEQMYMNTFLPKNEDPTK